MILILFDSFSFLFYFLLTFLLNLSDVCCLLNYATKHVSGLNWTLEYLTMEREQYQLDLLFQ
jgi:hypothetical protein